jgi:hypothetical protein
MRSKRFEVMFYCNNCKGTFRLSFPFGTIIHRLHSPDYGNTVLAEYPNDRRSKKSCDHCGSDKIE